MDDEVNTLISESVQNNIVFSHHSFASPEFYFRYLYLLARDHINNPELKDSIASSIKYQFIYNYTFIVRMVELNLKEVLYLISLLSKEDIVKSIYYIIKTVNNRIPYKMTKEKTIELLNKIFNSLITSTEYTDYLITTYSDLAMCDYLNVLSPSYDEAKSILDKYSNSDYTADLYIIKEYLDKIILNQV